MSKSKLRARFESFSRGDWISLIVASEQCNEQAATARCRSNRRAHDDLESRAARAEMLVSCTASIGGCCVGSTKSGNFGRFERRNLATSPCSGSFADRSHVACARQTIRSGRGAILSQPQICETRCSGGTFRDDTSGPFSMTPTPPTCCLGWVKLCRGEVPQSVVRMVRQGRMTALAKPDGGVRGNRNCTLPVRPPNESRMRVRGSRAAGLDGTRSTGNRHFNRRHR